MGRRIVTRPDWLTRTVKERFDEKWMPEPFSGCWLWTGSFNNSGYGRLSYKCKPVHAHRISWLVAHGEMPPAEKLVCHRCDTKCCVNPNHLFLGTYTDNLRDAIAKGIHAYSIGYGKDWTKIRSPRRPLDKPSCKYGHSYPENLYISPQGGKSCRECRRLSGIVTRTNQGKPPVAI